MPRLIVLSRILCVAPIVALLVGCNPSQPKDKPAGVTAVAEETVPAPPMPQVASPKVELASNDPPSAGNTNASKYTAKTPRYLQGVPLITRDDLFGNPDKAAARISPDGKRLSYLAPDHGVLNVWVGPADEPAAAKPVTKDRKRGIQSYFWAFTNRHVLYLQDTEGDENWRVYSVDIESGETKDLTPLEKVAAQIQEVSWRFPGEILVGLNDRNAELHDLYKVDIASGKRELLEKNEQGFMGYVTDEEYRVRFAMRQLDEGGNELLKPNGKGEWKEFLKIGLADAMTTSVAGFDKSGDTMYLIDSRNRDTGALAAMNLKTEDAKLLAESDRADIGGALMHPTENTVLAASFTYERKQWKVLDPKVEEDFAYLSKLEDGELEITSQTQDNQRWTVAYIKDNGPLRFYLYDRQPERKATFLFSSRKALEDLPLVKMHARVIKSRDGLDLVSYLSLPKGADPDGDGIPTEPLPMVLDVHGGPWARDDWGFSDEHQLYANRGYAVLSVNYRGSTGFGKAFINAGNREWAGKMHDDLLDAVNWCVEQKIADRERVAILGGSYGGYAALVGLTKTPDFFACGVDLVGPSNILTLLATIPPYWKPDINMFRDRVGDFTTEEGRKFLEERSPLTHVANIKKPLLIGQGANDPRVKKSEADQVVEALEKKHIPVTYLLYPDEGHGFARPQNRLSFQAVTEAFLAEYLHGRYQPIGDDFAGSSVTVPVGADGVPGLSAALKK
jgi:dipeptidyl aminopeptidase/acylaminoacyl peptidase